MCLAIWTWAFVRRSLQNLDVMTKERKRQLKLNILYTIEINLDIYKQPYLEILQRSTETPKKKEKEREKKKGKMGDGKRK